MATWIRSAAHKHRALCARWHTRYRRTDLAAARQRVQIAMSVLLETRALSKSFGALRAIQDVNFALEVGARHALIGPNGAGKTTFVNLLTGVLPPSAGRVMLAGADITGLRPEKRVKLGIA